MLSIAMVFLFILHYFLENNFTLVIYICLDYYSLIFLYSPNYYSRNLCYNIAYFQVPIKNPSQKGETLNRHLHHRYTKEKMVQFGPWMQDNKNSLAESIKIMY